MEIYGLEISKTSELAPSKSFDIIFLVSRLPKHLGNVIKIELLFSSKSAHHYAVNVKI